MTPWKMTLKEFIGNAPPQGDNATPADDLFDMLTWDAATLQDINGHYATAVLNGNPEEQVLLFKDTGTWKPVGFYLGDTVYVSVPHRRTGMPEELFLRGLEHRAHPGDWLRTDKGDSLLRRAHKLSVTRAVAAGEQVPAEVSAEYGL